MWTHRGWASLVKDLLSQAVELRAERKNLEEAGFREVREFA